MSSIAARIGALIVLLMISFGLGFWTKGEFVLADQAKHSQVVVKDAAKGIEHSVKESARIETEVATTDDAVKQIKAEIAKRGVTISHKSVCKPKPEQSNDRIDPNVGQTRPEMAMVEVNDDFGGTFFIDLESLRLLNDARKGRPLVPTGRSNEEKPGASTVAVDDLVQNDLEVVRMYHDLAKRHDELVDAVEKKLHEQTR